MAGVWWNGHTVQPGARGPAELSFAAWSCLRSPPPAACCKGGMHKDGHTGIRIVANRPRLSAKFRQEMVNGTGGPSPQFRYAIPPPLPAFWAHLVTKGQ